MQHGASASVNKCSRGGDRYILICAYSSNPCRLVVRADGKGGRVGRDDGWVRRLHNMDGSVQAKHKSSHDLNKFNIMSWRRISSGLVGLDADHDADP